jgi:hypothetical protein
MSTLPLKQGLYIIVRDRESGKVGLCAPFTVRNVTLPLNINQYKIHFITRFDENRHEKIIEVFLIDEELQKQLKNMSPYGVYIIQDVETNYYGLNVPFYFRYETPFQLRVDGDVYTIAFIRYGKINDKKYKKVRKIYMVD